jgi:hypothetical protein
MSTYSTTTTTTNFSIVLQGQEVVRRIAAFDLKNSKLTEYNQA